MREEGFRYLFPLSLQVPVNRMKTRGSVRAALDDLDFSDKPGISLPSEASYYRPRLVHCNKATGAAYMQYWVRVLHAVGILLDAGDYSRVWRYVTTGC